MPILLKEDMERALPKMYRVRQKFDDTHLDDVAAAVRDELAKPEIKEMIKPGMKVAIGAGSRGIRNIYLIIETLVNGLKELGAKPFIVSAMGSHGNASEEGQREVLKGYGITEERLGVPVITKVDSLDLGRCRNGRTVWFDRTAYEADLVIPVNRVKLHTDFIGELQSGLCKMLVIGFGNHVGCSAVHEEPVADFSEIIEETASIIIDKAPIGFGLAILENAYDQTMMIEAVPASVMVKREKELVKIAKANFARILLPEADVIICQEIGKNISGPGFDPNVLGRSSLRDVFETQIPKYQKLVLTGLSEGTHNNGLGIGLFDVVTRNATENLDLEAMYANAISCNALIEVAIPCTVDDEETAIKVALKCCRGVDRDNPKLLRIKNTLELGYIEVSEALLPEVEKIAGLELCDE